MVPALDYRGPVQVPYSPLPPASLTTPLFTLFTDQVRQRPDKLAIWDGVAGYTYTDLYQRACLTAQRIGPSIGKEQQPIGIWLPNDRQFIAAMLTALALGRPYIPLDITMPLERNVAILRQALVSDIITNSAHKGALQSLDITLLDLDEDPAGQIVTTFQPTASPESLAYIIYTSGTTGTPKGVVQNQRNLIHDVSQYINSSHLSADDRLSLLYSPTVNGAIRDIFGALLTGATLYIRNLRQHGIASLPAFIREHQLTIYHSIPTIFRAFLMAAGQHLFSSVRLVYLAGDRIIPQDVTHYRRHFPASSFLYIGIGSTENATIYRQWFINHDTPLTGSLLPVGYGVPDRSMHLQAPDGSPTPPGEAGEIVVDSPYMALGYWQNVVLTQAAFTTTTTGRRFRTGDLGRLRADGLLEFIGRRDRQVKVAGHRIELAAVEAVIRQAPLVEDVVLIGRQVATEQLLVAYVVSTDAFDSGAVRAYCLDYLPAYMVPTHWERLDEVPLLPNFKVDTGTIQRLDAQRATVAANPENPLPVGAMTNVDRIRRTLRDAWCASGAGLPEAYAANDSWYSGGGSSLEAVAFMLRLEDQLGISVPSDWIHGGMKPMWLEEQLLGRVNQLQQPPGSAESRPVVHFFPALSGLGEAVELVRMLQPHASVHLIQYPDLHFVSRQPGGYQLFMDAVMDQIATLPKADLLVGSCSGSFAAHEVARRLQCAQAASPLLVIIDMRAPLGFGIPFRVVSTRGLKTTLALVAAKSLRNNLIELVRSLFPGWTNLTWAGRHTYQHDDPYNVFTGLVRLQLLPAPVHLFRMKNDQTLLRWDWLCDHLIITDFPFFHDGMFGEATHCREIADALLTLARQPIPC